MKTLALVPAKARSTGIPGKNVRLFVGKPLFSWAVEVGKATCDDVYVTTDDPGIGMLATYYRAGFVLSDKHSDTSAMLTIVQDVLEKVQHMFVPDVVVLLQPTQPLRQAKHVQLALEMLTDEWDSVVSVVQIPAHYSPDYAASIQDERLVLRSEVTRRQDARPAYSRDGTVYAIRRECIEAGSLYGDCRALVIPHEESCNLDTEEDWLRAEQMTTARNQCAQGIVRSCGPNRWRANWS